MPVSKDLEARLQWEEAYQGRRNAWVPNKKVTIWRPRDSDESCHLVSGSRWRYRAVCAKMKAVLTDQMVDL